MHSSAVLKWLSRKWNQSNYRVHHTRKPTAIATVFSANHDLIKFSEKFTLCKNQWGAKVNHMVTPKTRWCGTNQNQYHTSLLALLVKPRPIPCGMKILQDFYSRKFSEFSGDSRKLSPSEIYSICLYYWISIKLTANNITADKKDHDTKLNVIDW